MADVFGIEKVWASIYEANRQHGDNNSKKSKPDLVYECEYLGHFWIYLYSLKYAFKGGVKSNSAQQYL